MCFTCWWVPVEDVLLYRPDGTLAEVLGPFFDFAHLMTAEEMVDEHICHKLSVAKTSIEAVTALRKNMIGKYNLKRPAQEIGT